MKRADIGELIILLALAGLGLYILKGGNLNLSEFLHFNLEDGSKAVSSNVNLSKLYSNYATISNVAVNDSSLNVKVNVEYNESKEINPKNMTKLYTFGNVNVYKVNNNEVYIDKGKIFIKMTGGIEQSPVLMNVSGSVDLIANIQLKGDRHFPQDYFKNRLGALSIYFKYCSSGNCNYYDYYQYLTFPNGLINFLTSYKKEIHKGIIYAPNGVNVNSNNIIKFYANAKKLYLKQQKNNAIMYVVFEDAKINGKYIKNSMMRLDINTTRLMELINNATQSVNYYYDKDKDSDNAYIIIKLDKDLILENKANDTFYNAYLYTSNDLVDVNKVSNEALTSQVLDSIINAFSLLVNGDKASFTITKIVFPAGQKLEIKISKTWIDYSALTKDRATEMLLESNAYSNQLNGNAKTYNIVFNSNTWIKNFYKQANSNLILAFDS